MAALRGRVGLVSGGASGIGLATVARLREAEAAVAVLDLRPPPAGGCDLALEGDVGDPRSWQDAVQRVERELGGLDLAHLNAGVVTGEADVDRVTDDAYRRVMRVNVDGAVFGLRAVVPAMERRGGGRVVATASLAGLTAFAHDPLYTASKHAVVGLVRSAAQRLEPRGVTVDAVCPGITETPLLAAEEVSALHQASFPLLQADDIAMAVLHLMTTPGTGRCLACQPGREPVVFRFGGVPGPRAAGGTGVIPPLP